LAAGFGEKKNYINHYNELAVTLNQASTDRSIVVKFRLFNDGLGFRYEFPQQKNLNYFVIREEDSEIDFPTDMKAWWIVADYDSQEYQYQETKFLKFLQDGQAADANASQTLIKNAVQSPVMLKKEGKDPLYINVAEAAVLIIRLLIWKLMLRILNSKHILQQTDKVQKVIFKRLL
jgi:hypothetical protein